MSNPLVSIIVPVYNREAYIGACLESIAAQTLEDIEVICVNDGSTDGTLAVLRAFESRDGRFKVIDKPNSGYGASMNTGMDAMTGVWMGSVESDDTVPAHAYQDMLEAAQRYDLDFVKADRENVYGIGSAATGKRNPVLRDDALYGKVLDPSANPRACGIKTGQPGLYKAAFLHEHGIRHNETPGAAYQDTGFWAQCLFHASRAMVLRDCLYSIRADTPDSSSVVTDKVFSICGEYEFIRAKALEVDERRREVCLKSVASMMFDGYRWNEQRIALASREEFVAYECDQYRRLDELGELDPAFFTEARWDQLRLLIEHPMEYYARYCSSMRDEVRTGKAKLRKARKLAEEREGELEKLRKSGSYRAGRAVTWLPRKAKKKVAAKTASIAKAARDAGGAKADAAVQSAKGRFGKALARGGRAGKRDKTT